MTHHYGTPMPSTRTLAVPCVLLTLLVACSRPAPGHVRTAAVTVTVRPAVVQSLPRWRAAVGEITAGAEPFVATPVSGHVDALMVTAGEHIRARSVVATIAPASAPGARRPPMIHVRAPVAATVTRTLVAPGATVAAGTALVALTGTHIRQARLPFLAAVAGYLHIGMRVWLHSPLAPRSRLPGVLATVRPTASGRAVYAYVDLPPLAGFGTGTPIRAEVPIARLTVVAVPAPSVVLRRPGTVVFAIHHHHAVMTRVRVAIRRRHLIGLQSGLAAGTEVAITGIRYLHNGSLVHVRRPA